MINVNQITSQLARMPDQALQQYAALHKGDPYTVALALSESNRRKQMRTASQMPQGGEPPKVVDQQLAEMGPPQPAQVMPEDVGIGALPAGNMDFAEGGIVAFADGGSAIGNIQAQGVDALRPLASQIQQAEQAYITAARSGDQAAISAYGKALSDLKSQLAGSVETQFGNAAPAVMAQLSAPAPAQEAPGFTRPAMAGDPRMAPGFQIPDQPAPAGRRAPPADGDGITRLLAPRAAGPASATSGGDFLSQYQATQGRLGPAEDEFRVKRDAITDTAVTGLQAGLAKRKAEQEEALTSMGKGKEERLGKREAALEKSKDTNTGLALLEAGLAMMQATGPGLSGIAKGAGVGVKAYAAGIDKIKTGQEKIDEARDRMEELRQNQVNMNASEVRADEREILRTQVEGQRDILRGAEQAGVKQQAIALAATTSDIAGQRAQEQQASAERIAGQNRAALAERLGGAGGKLDVKKIEVELKSLEGELEKLTRAKADDARRITLRKNIDDLRKQLRDGTIAPPSTDPALGGTQTGWGIKPIS